MDTTTVARLLTDEELAVEGITHKASYYEASELLVIRFEDSHGRETPAEVELEHHEALALRDFLNELHEKGTL